MGVSHLVAIHTAVEGVPSAKAEAIDTGGTQFGLSPFHFIPSGDGGGGRGDRGGRS